MMTEAQYRQIIDAKLGLTNPYCTLDARELRTDNIQPGDTIELVISHDDSVIQDVVAVNLETRELQISVSHGALVWVTMKRKKKYDRWVYQHILDTDLPAQARIQMLENKLTRLGIQGLT